MHDIVHQSQNSCTRTISNYLLYKKGSTPSISTLVLTSKLLDSRVESKTCNMVKNLQAKKKAFVDTVSKSKSTIKIVEEEYLP